MGKLAVFGLCSIYFDIYIIFTEGEWSRICDQLTVHEQPSKLHLFQSLQSW